MNIAKLNNLLERLRDVAAELADVIDADRVDDGPTAPGDDPFEWSWFGTIGREPEVLEDDGDPRLDVFPEGVYRFNLEVTPPEHLLGAKKDFRVLLIDIVDQGRGLDPERQFHVECGATAATLFYGGHLLRGGAGWPGPDLDTSGPKDDGILGTSYVVDVPMPFRLVLGEFVVPDPKARKTSPEGTRYKIEMIRE